MAVTASLTLYPRNRGDHPCSRGWPRDTTIGMSGKANASHHRRRCGRYDQVHRHKVEALPKGLGSWSADAPAWQRYTHQVEPSRPQYAPLFASFS